MTQYSINVYEPDLSGNEAKYLHECIESGWISSRGKFVEQFERVFEKFVGMPSTTVSNGTTALHLALWALGIQSGDEVIVPSLTYIATANAVKYMGATPVFVDVDPYTWQICPEAIARAITKRTKAVLVVHLFGQACDMIKIQSLCDGNQLLLIEDCAEALGTFVGDKHVGCFGRAATFSFFGNKTITTGEGGMVCMHDPMTMALAKKLKNQGVSATVEYWHEVIAHNFRMTNMQAALGCAQMENIDSTLESKRKLHQIYKEKLLSQEVDFQKEYTGTSGSYWMNAILLKNRRTRDALRAHLKDSGIETRPMFPPIHKMPPYENGQKLEFTEFISDRGLMLPSAPKSYQKNAAFVTQSAAAFFPTRRYI